MSSPSRFSQVGYSQQLCYTVMSWVKVLFYRAGRRREFVFIAIHFVRKLVSECSFKPVFALAMYFCCQISQQPTPSAYKTCTQALH